MLDLGIDAIQKRGREEQKTIEENSDSKKPVNETVTSCNLYKKQKHCCSCNDITFFSYRYSQRRSEQLLSHSTPGCCRCTMQKNMGQEQVIGSKVLPAEHSNANTTQSCCSLHNPRKNHFRKPLNMKVLTCSIISPPFSPFSLSLFHSPPPSTPLHSTSALYSMNTSAFFLSVFGQKLYPTFITDTSLQFQIPTLCQIPISCCLISIHLLLFLLLLPFPAWTSSNPASSNFLRKAPY